MAQSSMSNSVEMASSASAVKEAEKVANMPEETERSSTGHDTPIPQEAATTDFPDPLKNVEALAADVNQLRKDFDDLRDHVHNVLSDFMVARFSELAQGIAGKFRLLLGHLETTNRGITAHVDIDDEKSRPAE